MYVLVKFQLHIYSKTFSSNRKSICRVSIGKINYRHLLKQVLLTNGELYRLKICTMMFAMNQGMNWWVSLSFYYASPQKSQNP